MNARAGIGAAVRIGCLHVPRFAVAAAVRAEPALAGQPLVVLGDTVPARTVVEAADAARAQGVHPGMTEGQLRAEPRSVICRERSAEQEAAAHRTLLDVALAHSPRVEDGGPGLVYLDVAGLQGVFGSEEQIGQRLCRAAAGSGLAARVGIAGSRAAARLAARATPDVAVIPPGREPAALAPAPLALLDLPREMAERLDRWGLRTVGDLAALPPRALFERLGEHGLAFHRLARGEDPRPLRTWVPPPVVEAVGRLDGAVEAVEPIHAVLGALVQEVCAGLDRQQQMADRIEWVCRLAGGGEHGGALVPAVPTREVSAVRALLRSAVEARPPAAPVEGVLLRAWPVRVAPTQERLDGPGRPSPRRLAETLARLAALVGSERIGIPVLLDSHRSDPVRLDPFTPPAPHPAGAAAGPRGARGDRESAMSSTRASMALRRLRPARRACVTLVGGRPVHLRAEGCTGRVVASAGPWRSSGEWWGESRWARDEWDVELQDGMICRVSTDGRAWSVEGIYD